MFTRRKFIQYTGLGSATLLPFVSWAKAREVFDKDGFSDLCSNALTNTTNDEEFWYQVRMAYTINPNLINLNNGGVSPAPKIVQEALTRYNNLVNEGPSYYMWRILDQGREPLRLKLADLAGCSEEEIAINRNASEALETIIFGLPLKQGDEVILTKQDYPNMINAWKQRELRDGIVLKWLNFDLPIENKEEIASAYAAQFTDRTKICHVTHVINWTGQIMPVKEIAREAHKRGIEVLADGAHSFMHFNFKIPDLDCDYFGTSLHKWMGAPIGSGLMYIKRDKIKKVYPLLAAGIDEADNIRKFERLGTRSFPIEQAISEAVDFNNMIGMERKEKRLRYLKNYWAEKVSKLSNVKLNTSLKDDFSCAIANFSIDGKKPEEIDSFLMDKHRIHTVGINWENIHGVRVTPNVYTLTSDLDKLVNAIEQFAKA
jgi:selenocysteine lyase/cysteine desulfurase